MRKVTAISITRASTLLLATAMLAAGQPQNRVGLEPVGFLAFAPNDVTQTSDIYKTCPANRGCEMAFLAYSFSTSFNNATKFVQSVLPSYGSNQVLVITLYLDDGANRDGTHAWCYFHPEWRPSDFWSHVQNDSLHTDWRDHMAKPAGDWIRSIKAWANSKGWGNRIRFIVVPVLEDGGPAAADHPAGWVYARLRDWTAEGINDGAVSYRRNSTTVNADRIPGVPMEFHRTSLNASIVSNDVITSDGDNISEPAWAGVQASAHARGVSALWWVAGFNSNTSTRTTPPWQRGPLMPFTNNPSLVAQSKALMVAR
jgi:hypothetical protein